MSFFKKLFGKNKEQQVNENADLTGLEQVETAGGQQAEEEKTAETKEQPTNLEGDAQKEAEQEEKTDEAVFNQAADDSLVATPMKETADESVEEEENSASEAAQISDEESKNAAEDNTDEIEQKAIIEDETADKEQQPAEEAADGEKKSGFIKRLFSGLSKTRDSILKGVDDVLSGFKHIDDDLYEELEEALIMADFGVDTTLHIMEKLKAKVKEDKITDPSSLKPALQEIITGILTDHPTEDILNPEGPTVVLVIGVNGVGKTTSIGKMAHLFKLQGKKVLVAAADTFRAAAIEQLNIWTERAGVEIIKHEEGSDAAAVVFDAISAAKSRKSDVLICDTAGRLQNKTNLMKELEKISRIVAREYPEAKKEILIVIDATTGQNAMQQVKLFKEVADISGIILTKLDGTAKGGAIVGIYESLKVPVKYIGIGEKIDDLQSFDAQAFAKALFEAEA